MDQYEELEVIGTGAFGKVCKIRRKCDDKILVWKELNYGAMNEQEKQQLVAEVNILRELRNPFIVRYYDRIVDKRTTRLYIVMEHCAGGDLGKVIRKCKRDRTNLDEAIIWRIFSQIVLALKDCHRRVENGERKPILHRDLKPANIMLDQDENLKIGDFGLAKELSGESKLARTNVGTPFYMSPELVNGNKYDERSDIWAVGCLLYELASLRPPFDAPNQLTLAMKISAGRFHRIPNKYSDDLQNAIRAMLQVDSSKRPRIEELTNLPALQSALRQSNVIVKEAQLNQSYSAKWRELKSREVALNDREERLRKLEEQLASRERALSVREKKLQVAERQQQPSSVSSSLFGSHRLQQQQQQHGGGGGVPAMRRASSLPVAPAVILERESSVDSDPVENSEEDRDSEDHENRRMSLQLEDPIPLPIAVPQEQYSGEHHRQDRHGAGHGTGHGAGAPFKIFADDSGASVVTATAAGERKRDDFASGVARARELLNRPRLMNLEGNRQHRPLSGAGTGAGAECFYPSGATGSTFYKNYIAHKKTAAEGGQGQAPGIENVKPVGLGIGKSMGIGMGQRQEARKQQQQPQVQPQQQQQAGGGGGDCGSATKRSRFDYEGLASDGQQGQGQGMGSVPSVQVDLHSLMMAGRGKFDNL